VHETYHSPPSNGKAWYLVKHGDNFIFTFAVRALMTVSGLGEEVQGGWIKFHFDGLHNLYFSPDIVGVIQSRRME
jgi:hypothetical protein